MLGDERCGSMALLTRRVAATSPLRGEVKARAVARNQIPKTPRVPSQISLMARKKTSQ